MWQLRCDDDDDGGDDRRLRFLSRRRLQHTNIAAEWPSGVRAARARGAHAHSYLPANDAPSALFRTYNRAI